MPGSYIAAFPHGSGLGVGRVGHARTFLWFGGKLTEPDVSRKFAECKH
jgi:hypothetical protein